MSEPFRLQLKVRDYECDMQGIVNNSVYQNYFEHARHEYLLHRGLSFADFTKRGINLVVTRIEIDFKGSLTSGDEFWVSVAVKPHGRLRAEFEQTIVRAADERLVTQAKVFAVGLDPRGRPLPMAELTNLFSDGP